MVQYAYVCVHVYKGWQTVVVLMCVCLCVCVCAYVNMCVWGNQTAKNI